MSDRELLELAARAAGIDVVEERSGGLPWTVEDDSDRRFPWNPVDDDGDALRLAVALDLGIELMRAIGVVRCGNGDQEVIVERLGDYPCAATRRAIVRAAAEIGKEKSK